MAWSSVAVVVVVVGLALGEGDVVVGLVHPAAKTVASITNANAPARIDFLMVTLIQVLRC